MMRRRSSDVQLLHGPYTAPPLKRGDRAFCLLRDTEVIITSWSDGRIAWPKCRIVGHRGGHGLLLDEELARAVRSESSLAIQYWWGASPVAVWHWRKALGIGHWEPEGSRLLQQQSSEKGAAKN